MPCFSWASKLNHITKHSPHLFNTVILLYLFYLKYKLRMKWDMLKDQNEKPNYLRFLKRGCFQLENNHGFCDVSTRNNYINHLFIQASPLNYHRNICTNVFRWSGNDCWLVSFIWVIPWSPAWEHNVRSFPWVACFLRVLPGRHSWSLDLVYLFKEVWKVRYTLWRQRYCLFPK